MLFRQSSSSLYAVGFCLALTLLTGCGASSAFKKGKKFENEHNLDEALAHYYEAYEKDPKNHEYRLYFERMRTQAAIAHIDLGRKFRGLGKLTDAASEFRRAAEIDPSNFLAVQEIQAVEKEIQESERKAEEEKKRLADIVEKNKTGSPRENLGTSTTTPIGLKLTGDLKRAYESIAKISGINVIFDADLGNKLTTQVPVELNNVTVVEALDLLALQTKTYWAVVNKNTIIVTNDNQQTRQFYEEQIIKTFYLGNSLATADLQEVLNTLRTLLDLRKVGVINSQNAIVVRDTADKIAMAEKILQSIDKAKPEVLIDVALMEVSRSFTRRLGVTPPPGVTAVNPPGTTGTSMSIKDLDRLGSGNFYITLPTAQLNISRTDAKVLQNPSLRASDGKLAKLRIGRQQPVAQGSFQPTFGGSVGGSPVVQFTTIDVGVNVDMTPRVMMNRDIAMNVKVEIKSIQGFLTLSGNDYPILSNRSVEHDIRLKEGESSVIGGIISDDDSVATNGIPGVERIPFIKYLFSSEKKDKTEIEIIIVITPHIVRLPDLQDSDLESLSILGSGISPKYVGKPLQLGADQTASPKSANTPALPLTSPSSNSQPGSAAASTPDAPPVPRLSFVRLSSSTTESAVGSRVTVTAAIENAQQVSGFSFGLSFDPKILKLVGVLEGGFVSQGGKPLIQAPKIDNDAGTAVITFSSPSSGVSGSGTLFNVMFDTVGSGTSQVVLTQAALSDDRQAPLPTSSSGTQVTVK